MKTVQSDLTFKDNSVVKRYNRNFKFYKKENFESELRVIEKFQESDFCIKTWDTNEHGYTMERLDFDLGTDRELNHDRVRRIFFSLRITDILNMLEGIKSDLEMYGIRHRDINPGNLLWSEKDKKIKLTDFFWADSIDNEISCPNAVNQIYSKDDAAAIEKIRNEIIEVYEEMKPELEKVYDDFQEVGKNVHIKGRGRNAVVTGDYKDGSSIHKGWAYHIVDIPYFKYKINHHKDMCIEEYKLIKKNLKIEPKKILDIGCSVGYHLFNFLREFNLKLAQGFEADENVFKFLNGCKQIYKLNEAKFSQAFDDTIKLEKFDIAIWLNSHMWIYKQIGKERTLKAVSNVIKNSQYLFFQTAGNYSSSIYKVTEFQTVDDIKNMLLSAGAKSVQRLQTFVGSHGAPRDMFLVKS